MDGGDGSLQRVRVGLTGLACVFLLVLLAASIFGLAGRNPPSVLGGGDAAGNAATNSQEAPKEPLAELGVAPGNAPDRGVGNTMAPPAASTITPFAPPQAGAAAKPAR